MFADKMKDVSFAKNIPNIVTFLRIVFACVMLFSDAYSVLFYVTFSLAVLSDILDGFLARVLSAESERGSRLDTFADFLFLIFTLCVLIPAVNFPNWTLYALISIAAVKILAAIIGFIKRRKIAIPHNVFNKIAGVTLTICVLVLTVNVEITCIVAVCVCGIAAVIDVILALRGEKNEI